MAPTSHRSAPTTPSTYSSTIPTADMIQRIQTEPTKPWIETPLIESATLSKAAGCRIFLKLDNVQPSGSFKIRGLGNLVLQSYKEQEHSTDNRPLHFFASSGGNAGLAAVTASSALELPCTVVVPSTTEDTMIAKIRAAGARDVIVHGESWINADQHMREVVMLQSEQAGEKPIYLPPFDNPAIWTGNSTIVHELATQMPDSAQPDAIVCSVGGGGLFNGIMQGLHAYDWQLETQVIAVETLGTDSLAQSLEKQHLVTLPGITSIAKSLAAVTVSEKTFEYALHANVTSVVIEDAEAAAGCWRFADDERILVEPACGASVAMCYDGRLRRLVSNFSKNTKVVIVVCGGSRISLNELCGYRSKFGARAAQLGLTGCKDVASSHA